MKTDRSPQLFSPLPLLAMDTPVGRLWLESDGMVVTRTAFTALGRPAQRTPTVLRTAAKQVEQYFAGTRKRFDLPLAQLGTPFRRRVWKELLAIPYGRVKSYQEISARMGGNARSVGSACAWNPLLLLVPCHRVVTAEGLLTGYQGGLWRKRWLLEHEGALPTMG